MKPGIHRDQIHRDVHYDPMSISLINTPQMQRLGRVYQLGFAHLVYRGGTHTRLSHVMGAAAVAEQLVTTLRRNYETAINSNTCPEGAILPENFLPGSTGGKGSIDDRWDALLHLVKWAALLHDIGHIPIGHTLEDEFADIYEKHDDFKSRRMPFLWDEIVKGKNSPIKDTFLTGDKEKLYPPSFQKLNILPKDAWHTVMLICLYKAGYEPNEKSSEPFEKLYSEALIEAKKKKLFHRYMAEIVADTICADYIDYVQRDTLNVGFDSMKENRLIQSYFVGEDLVQKENKNVEYRMALSLVDRNGKPKLSVCTAAKNMVRHRFDLAETIYYHKTKVSASAMLAKVFFLIDPPLETGNFRKHIDINEIDTLAQNLLSPTSSKGVAELKSECVPDCLLHPFIGDESMLFWLQEKAWEKVNTATVNNDKIELRKALLAISFLEAIIERRLYKVAFFIDENLIQKILDGGQPKVVTTTMQDILTRYRKNEEKGKSHKEREDTEKLMAESASFPNGTFIIYVPGAKSQAKGIETGALHKGKVITLGEHSVVKKDVETLNEAYKNLWRMLIFVHPSYQKDNICLSIAVDKLLESIFEGVKLRRYVQVIKEACWFHYIPAHNRTAAKTYIGLHEPDVYSVKWKNFDDAKYTAKDSMNPEEHADRAFLLDLIDKITNKKHDWLDDLKREFAKAGSLSKAIEKELATEVYAHTGNPKANRIAVLELIAKKITKGILPGLFSND